MGFLDFLTGGTPEKYEQKADAFVVNGSYGHAKTEYEKALAKLERQTDAKPDYRHQIEDKLWHCKEALALLHKKNGDALIESGCHDDAMELFHLAMELTTDHDLTTQLQKRLDNIPEAVEIPENCTLPDYITSDADADEEEDAGSEDEYFTALCNSLEDAEQDEYRSYPDTFRQGFVALNRGDFKVAVSLLTEAHNAWPTAASYITLELATAHLNLGDNGQARELLASFLEKHPESLKAYYLMCEILWENKAFDAVENLLSNCPEKLSKTLPFKMLAGETLIRSRRYDDAVFFFREILETGPMDNTVAQSLAGVYEKLGQPEKAKALYAEIMDTCTGCGAHVDPVVKLRYAETSFATGDFSIKILELYLTLARDDAANRLHFYRRISHIYEKQGNKSEALRFEAFAQKLAKEDNSLVERDE